jgi:hypothetical protein
MDETNPFKLMESDDICPAHIKTELFSEIDLIRNALAVITLFAGGLSGVASKLITPDINPSKRT